MSSKPKVSSPPSPSLICPSTCVCATHAMLHRVAISAYIIHAVRSLPRGEGRRAFDLHSSARPPPSFPNTGLYLSPKPATASHRMLGNTDTIAPSSCMS